ncbi:protein of unknown function [endosymbiont DhMRE of Dentiscutata heterogama]|nr:protein of unknown function [endosymbiont DhMRE of Dentiscutata heterogama]
MAVRVGVKSVWDKNNKKTIIAITSHRLMTVINPPPQTMKIIHQKVLIKKIIFFRQLMTIMTIQRRERERESNKDASPRNLPPPGEPNKTAAPTKKTAPAPLIVSGTIGGVIVVGVIATYLTVKKSKKGRYPHFKRKK